MYNESVKSCEKNVAWLMKWKKEIHGCTQHIYTKTLLFFCLFLYIYFFKLAKTQKASAECLCHWATLHIGSISLSYFSFQPVLRDWCNKGHGMCYPVCGMVYIKELLLLIGKSSLWQQQVSFLTIRMVLNHVWRHITVNKMCWVHR